MTVLSVMRYYKRYERTPCRRFSAMTIFCAIRVMSVMSVVSVMSVMPKVRFFFSRNSLIFALFGQKSCELVKIVFFFPPLLFFPAQKIE